ncbi:hypothetical protein [Spirosoma sordidisoli]|uniref:Uncharacterized protein n=1 Tax=Spirosoma sordidisoli TaxID=2502893 RepID=A0A4Q2UMN4_9BACT|nr:hypothetical protein [Spirosoma sordidisoli]RYC70893.1 hypothetical protein EQG79_01700 [Spirosoma sordidisoli]
MEQQDELKGPALEQQRKDLLNWQISVKSKVVVVCRRLEATNSVTTQDITDLHKALDFLDELRKRLEMLKAI